MELRRRDLLKLGLFSSAALMLPAERIARTKSAFGDRIAASKLPKPFTVGFDVPPELPIAKSNLTWDAYRLDQIENAVEIIPGLKTPIWGYNGITPGPTIRVRRGRKVVVRQCNDLPGVHPQLRYKVWTSTHLHGSASLPQYDGYASDITNVAQWKDYKYPNSQDARTLWYHDHGVHQTASNAYMGLAAMYIQHDDLELGLPIPHGRYDVPLILRDAMFTKKGALIFDDNSESSAFGDVILANGKPWPVMKVERRKYRFRILNASISRSFLLKLSTGDPMYVIGTDGGLMPEPQATTRLRHGMAERYEVIIDFARYKVGQRVVLQNATCPTTARRPTPTR
jgi:spore coat protein A, manganese oxidase